MSRDESQKPVQLDPNLEREIRQGRKFSLSDALGRLAGPGMMKGVSPATRMQQAEAELESFLDRCLHSPGGALSAVLLRQVKESDLLLGNPDAPLAVLVSFLQRTLDSEYRLQQLVREADSEWGRAYGERPHFEKEGSPPHPDDPYTTESVRTSLSQLVEAAATAERRSANEGQPND
jgi:hypothetical protein